MNQHAAIEVDVTAMRAELVTALKDVVGSRQVHTSDAATRSYRMGYRFGGGRVLAVVCPGSLVEMWRVTSLVVAAGQILIMQASNTGLTGGSTPDGNDYDRDIVIVSTLRMAKVQLIQDGKQVICLPGATLNQLERLLKPLGREPHSVIGSSCIGASVLGGISNNSGGALVRRGPAFTEMALFARARADGTLELVNHLGVQLGDAPEEILTRLENQDYAATDVVDSGARASDNDYAAHVRDVDAATPARFNADPSRLFEASGSAGRMVLFAVRLDTFPREAETSVFYIGTNDTADLTAIRRGMLRSNQPLPIAGEYMHRDAFNLTERYGKDTFLAIRRLGTDKLPTLFRLKDKVDAMARKIGIRALSDRVLQLASRVAPSHLPPRMLEFRDRFEHHLVVRVSAADAGALRDLLDARLGPADADYYACTPVEAEAAFLHRFAAAGAAVRYRTIHAAEVEEIVALDIALRRDDQAWFETLPPEVEAGISHKLYYGHFFCHVFHQDYIVRKGVDPLALEHAMWALLDDRGAEYPAEHNVGHLYPAKPNLVEFYKELDPCNCLNPGIGQTSKQAHWQ